MNEKRVIDFEEFQGHHPYGAYCPGIECCEENCKPWQELKRPTPTDITGTRKLDSLTEDEIDELLAMLFSADVHEKCIDFREQDGQQAYQITLSDQDYHTWYITIGMGYFSAVCADDSIGGSIHPAKLIRWFIEKGFDVWGME